MRCATILRRTAFCLAFYSAALSGQQTSLSSDNASRFRGEEGRRVTVVCPPKTQPGSVWGSDVYTDDSSICGAALHAGIITQSEGGAVTAVMRAGRDSYKGSTRNDITSRDYGPWRGSFTVEKGDGGQIDWSTKAAGLENAGGTLAVVCPPGGDATASIWGSDTYTDDSPICVAAVHAGLITTARGGRVVLESVSGQPAYRGSARNGVASQTFGKWPRSFRFEGVVAEAAVRARTPVTRARTIQPSQPTAVNMEAGPVSAVAADVAPPAGYRTLTASTLAITGRQVQSLTRLLTTPVLSITGRGGYPPVRVFTAPPLNIVGR